jgi:hypothetical protein
MLVLIAALVAAILSHPARRAGVLIVVGIRQCALLRMLDCLQKWSLGFGKRFPKLANFEFCSKSFRAQDSHLIKWPSKFKTTYIFPKVVQPQQAIVVNVRSTESIFIARDKKWCVGTTNSGFFFNVSFVSTICKTHNIIASAITIFLGNPSDIVRKIGSSNQPQELLFLIKRKLFTRQTKRTVTHIAFNRVETPYQFVDKFRVWCVALLQRGRRSPDKCMFLFEFVPTMLGMLRNGETI